MDKRVAKALITCFAVGLLLTGCSQFPEMTEAEHDQTVQYMVSLLMKYSNNGVEKLSSLSSLELQHQMEKENREANKAARDKELAEALANKELQPEDGEETDGENTNEPAGNSEDSETTDLAQNDTDNKKEPSGEETATDTENSENTDEKTELENDISELIDKYEDDLNEGIKNAGGEVPEDESQTDTPDEPIPSDIVSGDEDSPSTEADKVVEGMRQELSKGMFLTYSGYSVATTYPDDDDVFVIHASSDKKLLILNFRLVNTSGMDVSVDMVKANPHFQVILNGINVGYTNVTMLDNDLSSYKGDVSTGEKKSMVLVKQMDAGKLKNVESLGLIGDLGGETIEFKLE